MKNETRSAQQILIAIKLGEEFTLNSNTSIIWGVYEEKYCLILTTKIQKVDNTYEFKTVQLFDDEALELITKSLNQ